MNIAMFSDNFYPELSGISDSIIELARGLATLGHQIEIYVPQYSGANFRIYGVPPAEVNLGSGINIHRLFSIGYPSPTKQGRMVFPEFLRCLSMRRKAVHIIHTHHFFGAGLEGLVASKLSRSPLIGTSHTPIAEFVDYCPLPSLLLKPVGMAFMTWYYNHCHFVSAPCQSIIDEMKITGFRKPHTVMSNPIDTDGFCPVSSLQEKARMRAEFDLSGFVVLYTGRLATEKHVDVIIRAIAVARYQIPWISLVITGHGSEEGTLQRLATDLHLRDRIKFLGTVSAEVLPRIYKAADVFAIASTAETQSLSLMKAMATAIPVVGVKARGLTEYIT